MRSHAFRIAVLTGAVGLVAAGYLVASQGMGDKAEALPQRPLCRRGYVAVAWPADGERLGCLERVEHLITFAEAQAGCTPGARPKIERPGVRIRLWREEAACDYDVSPLEGRVLIALGMPLDLNRATAQDLEALPGVGPKRAAAIVGFREANGGFRSVEDLERVPGLGPATVARLRPLLQVERDEP